MAREPNIEMRPATRPPGLSEKARLWVEEFVVLDDKNVITRPWQWTLPFEKAIKFGNARQVTFVMEYRVVGPGGASVGFDMQRCCAETEYSIAALSPSSLWESLPSSPPLTLGRSASTFTYTFGQDAPMADKYPRGYGRIVLSNSNATDGKFAEVWIRVWVVMV